MKRSRSVSFAVVVTALALLVACGRKTNDEAFGEMAQSICSRAATCAEGKASAGCADDVKNDLATASGLTDKEDTSPCTAKELDECKSALNTLGCDAFVITGGSFKLNGSKLPTACTCD